MRAFLTAYMILLYMIYVLNVLVGHGGRGGEGANVSKIPLRRCRASLRLKVP